jgi:glycosyltransferase involved in cell wall biosynthesis
MTEGLVDTMSEQKETHQIRIGIAAETISRGSLQSYIVRLDEAMRRCASDHHLLVTPRFVPTPELVEPATAPFKPTRMRRLLRRVPIFRWLVRRVRRSIYPRWPEAKNWATKWRSMPGDIICLVPHVLIDDGGELDSYYDAIAARRFIWVIHDLHGYHFPDQWDEDHLSRMRRRFRSLSKRATAIIVHNEFTALDVSQKLGIQSERIAVIRLPPILSTSSHQKPVETEDDVLSKLGITRPYALWASSSTFSHKNHERLLHAWRILLDHGHRIQLVCTGAKGPRWEQVNACILNLRLEDSVCFTGVIDESELAIVLNNARLAVCPTLFEGGGSGPASEALMASIPLAASDIPQIRQYFNDRKDLFSLFDPTRRDSIAKAVEDILLNYDFAKQRAQWARAEYSAMQTWEMTACEYWRAIERATQMHK